MCGLCEKKNQSATLIERKRIVVLESDLERKTKW